MVELDRGQAADEALRGCLCDHLIEVLPPCRGRRLKPGLFLNNRLEKDK